MEDQKQCFTCGEIKEDIETCKVCGEPICQDCREEHKWEDYDIEEVTRG